MLDLSPNGIRIYEALPWGMGRDVISPMVVNPYSVLTIPAYRRAMNFLSDNLASFPRSVTKDGAKRTDDTAPHPLERLMRRRPNACQNAYTFWRTLFFHAAHTGNGYAEIVRGGAVGYFPAALRNMLPEDVLPFRYDRGDGRGALQYYVHWPTRRVLLGENVIHLQALSYDGLKGIDTVPLHAETFQCAGMLLRYQTKYLQKGTVIRGAVQIPQGVSDEQAAEVVKTIREFFQGPNAERDVIVLSGGATLNNATISPQESQLIQQGAHLTKHIAQITGVPPQFLYEFTESKYNNSIEQMGQDVVRNTFRPWIEQTEDELTTKLLSEEDQDAGYAVHINPGALLRGDTKTQEEVVANSVKGGIRTRNEGRRLLDLPRDPDPSSDRLQALGETTPAAGGAAGAKPAPSTDPTGPVMNGYHVDAALKVISTLAAGDVCGIVATELLVAVGVARDRAEAMVKAASPDAEDEEEAAHEFSSTQFNLPGDVAARVLAFGATIPDEQLVDDGRETEPHVTVKYGLHTDDPAAVRLAVAGVPPVTFTLGRVSVFAATADRESDVVKINVEGDELHRLNKLLADKLPHTDTHAEYQPHVTLAYVKPGAGAAFEGRADLEGVRVTCNVLVFSSRDGTRTEIPLAASAPGATPPDAYSALEPVIAAACERVDRKTDKAFDNAASKTGQDRTIWANVFAEQQARYVVEALSPVVTALKALGAAELPDLPRLAERYAAGVRKRAATGEAAPLLPLLKPAA